MKPSEELKYSYIMEKNGKEYEFDIYPNNEIYTFKELKLLNPEAQPIITDYNLWDNDEDYTSESLLGNKLFIIIHDVNNIDKKLIDKIKTLNNNITFWIETVIITSNEPNSFKQFLESNNIKSFGQNQDCALIEGSKRYSKNLMKELELPTADYKVFDNKDDANEFLKNHFNNNYVLKL